MADHLTAERRSLNMAKIKGKDTRPELVVRRLLHRHGYRYQLHVKELPGTPDIVFAGRKIAVFVHGCFWHGHQCKRGGRIPKSNTPYWEQKLLRNIVRDKESQISLEVDGWRVIVVWECEVSDVDGLTSRLISLIGPTQNQANLSAPTTD